MSVIYTVNCPVCNAKEAMQADDDETSVSYFCFYCGFGVYLTEDKEPGYYKWDGRHSRNRFARYVTVRKKHNLRVTGRTLFYPSELVFKDAYGIYPATIENRLTWKLYIMKGNKRQKLMGVFSNYKDADDAGERYANG